MRYHFTQRVASLSNREQAASSDRGKMAAMLVKNALQLGLRARPGASGTRALSSISSGSFSASSSALPLPAVLMMATPANHMSARVSGPAKLSFAL
ncbi:hypothetical protein PHYPSEUDO_012263 [Phytophthora pseudosyringae]|uniref:Uncharacterized protein n=1 Tax=Phytophthora pseudosyringae TaxID=221518 RepID=A0A8T1VBX3_9STRA|nr:hypothetical protein PHYPSEUDO_012263 [Phytophthora pseudosyringae]